ncbi:hypothetical protein AT5A_04530 [Agrobacterium tumefaciens 5A]|nr:hypothetical protein AT5A_04530 [Agrobacterium tumefaciens 5A]
MGTAQASSCVGNFITITLRIIQPTDWFSHDPKIDGDFARCRAHIKASACHFRNYSINQNNMES